MICFPNAKINLGLNIISKRPDGFHNIETLMFPIPLFDVLEFTKAETFSIDIFGNNQNIKLEENTLFKTWKNIKTKYDIPALKIKLLKNIPSSAGLGGGSSDAAFLLKEINKTYNLNISISEMEEIISEIGSDCPFFIKNKTALASSRGEILKTMEIDLEGKYLSLIKPKWGIPTKEAFSKIKPKNPNKKISEIIQQPLNEWQGILINDFEETLIPNYPEIQNIKDYFYNREAEYASLSGSGSTVFAVSSNKIDMLKYKGDGFIWQKKL